MTKANQKGNTLKLIKRYWVLYVILLVTMVYYFIFHYIPIIWGVEISFKEMKIGSTIANAPWVGLANYKEIFENPEMFKLLRNTLVISISSLICGIVPPIILTVCIFDLRSTKFKKLSQTLVYIPHFFSWVIIYGIVYAFFSGNGLINGVIRNVSGGKIVDFLTNKNAFVPLLVGSQVWKEMGWSTILYFAALTSVSPELYEAAKIDGAGPLQRIKAVTFPAMKPIITFQLIMALGGILNTGMEQILLYYNSAVYEVADTIDTWVYRVGLGKMQYGLGSAVTMMKAFISLFLMLSANKFSKKVTGRGMF